MFSITSDPVVATALGEGAERALHTFLLAALGLALVKTLRYRHRSAIVPSELCFEDYRIVAGLAVADGAIAAAFPGAAPAISGILAIAFALLALDAVLFQYFSVELNLHSLRYVPDLVGGGFSAELGHLGATLPRGVLESALGWVLLLFALRDAAGPWAAVAATTAFALHLLACLVRLRGSGLDRRQPAGLLGGLVALAWLRAAAPAPLAGGVAGGALVLLALGWLVLGGMRRARPGPWLLRPSHLRHLLVPAFPPPAEEPPIRDEHRALLELDRRPPGRSPSFGRCAGANVLLVVLESVGSRHLELYRAGGARTPFLGALAEGGIVSRRHFCISPQTNNAQDVLMTGSYSARDGYDLFRSLGRAGYQSAYLYGGDSREFGLRRRLERAGFDRVIDAQAFGANGSGACDRRLLGAGVDRLLEVLEPKRPFFVQAMTADTHFPYGAGTLAGGDPRAERERYLRCVEAADGVWSELWRRLGDAGLLEHTIVVVCGDHGEAFGEMGYRYHSSAVIKEQVEVPFVLRAPGIEPGEVACSSHLDVLPTVLDLLGIDHGVACHGASLLDPARDRFPLLLYSELMSGGVPSCRGLLLDEAKLVVDVAYRRVWELDWEDRVRHDLTGDPYLPWMFDRVFGGVGVGRPPPGGPEPRRLSR